MPEGFQHQSEDGGPTRAARENGRRRAADRLGVCGGNGVWFACDRRDSRALEWAGFRPRHIQPASRVLYDTQTGKTWAPLAELRSEQNPDARFEVFDSSLSEEGVLGFEYGYSVVAQGALVLWEAQFGDFGNGAQTIIDQYIAASEDKWKQTSRLVMLLPHGYEGQGPEHSSARLERYLQIVRGEQSAGLLSDDARAVFPSAAPAGAPGHGAAADRHDAEEPAAFAGGSFAHRRSSRAEGFSR